MPNVRIPDWVLYLQDQSAIGERGGVYHGDEAIITVLKEGDFPNLPPEQSVRQFLDSLRKGLTVTGALLHTASIRLMMDSPYQPDVSDALEVRDHGSMKLLYEDPRHLLHGFWLQGGYRASEEKRLEMVGLELFQNARIHFLYYTNYQIFRRGESEVKTAVGLMTLSNEWQTPLSQQYVELRDQWVKNYKDAGVETLPSLEKQWVYLGGLLGEGEMFPDVLWNPRIVKDIILDSLNFYNLKNPEDRELLAKQCMATFNVYLNEAEVDAWRKPADVVYTVRRRLENPKRIKGIGKFAKFARAASYLHRSALLIAWDKLRFFSEQVEHATIERPRVEDPVRILLRSSLVSPPEPADDFYTPVEFDIRNSYLAHRRRLMNFLITVLNPEGQKDVSVRDYLITSRESIISGDADLQKLLDVLVQKFYLPLAGILKENALPLFKDQADHLRHLLGRTKKAEGLPMDYFDVVDHLLAALPDLFGTNHQNLARLDDPYYLLHPQNKRALSLAAMLTFEVYIDSEVYLQWRTVEDMVLGILDAHSYPQPIPDTEDGRMLRAVFTFNLLCIEEALKHLKSGEGSPSSGSSTPSSSTNNTPEAESDSGSETRSALEGDSESLFMGAAFLFGNPFEAFFFQSPELIALESILVTAVAAIAGYAAWKYRLGASVKGVPIEKKETDKVIRVPLSAEGYPLPVELSLHDQIVNLDKELQELIPFDLGWNVFYVELFKRDDETIWEQAERCKRVVLGLKNCLLILKDTRNPFLDEFDREQALRLLKYIYLTADIPPWPALGFAGENGSIHPVDYKFYLPSSVHLPGEEVLFYRRTEDDQGVPQKVIQERLPAIVYSYPRDLHAEEAAQLFFNLRPFLALYLELLPGALSMKVHSTPEDGSSGEVEGRILVVKSETPTVGATQVNQAGKSDSALFLGARILAGVDFVKEELGYYFWLVKDAIDHPQRTSYNLQWHLFALLFLPVSALEYAFERVGKLFPSRKGEEGSADEVGDAEKIEEPAEETEPEEVTLPKSSGIPDRKKLKTFWLEKWRGLPEELRNIASAILWIRDSFNPVNWDHQDQISWGIVEIQKRTAAGDENRRLLDKAFVTLKLPVFAAKLRPGVDPPSRERIQEIWLEVWYSLPEDLRNFAESFLWRNSPRNPENWNRADRIFVGLPHLIEGLENPEYKAVIDRLWDEVAAKLLSGDLDAEGRYSHREEPGDPWWRPNDQESAAIDTTQEFDEREDVSPVAHPEEADIEGDLVDIFELEKEIGELIARYSMIVYQTERSPFQIDLSIRPGEYDKDFQRRLVLIRNAIRSNLFVLDEPIENPTIDRGRVHARERIQQIIQEGYRALDPHNVKVGEGVSFSFYTYDVDMESRNVLLFLSGESEAEEDSDEKIMALEASREGILVIAVHLPAGGFNEKELGEFFYRMHCIAAERLGVRPNEIDLDRVGALKREPKRVDTSDETYDRGLPIPSLERGVDTMDFSDGTVVPFPGTPLPAPARPIEDSPIHHNDPDPDDDGPAVASFGSGFMMIAGGEEVFTQTQDQMMMGGIEVYTDGSAALAVNFETIEDVGAASSRENSGELVFSGQDAPPTGRLPEDWETILLESIALAERKGFTEVVHYLEFASDTEVEELFTDQEGLYANLIQSGYAEYASQLTQAEVKLSNHEIIQLNAAIIAGDVVSVTTLVEQKVGGASVPRTLEAEFEFFGASAGKSSIIRSPVLRVVR